MEVQRRRCRDELANGGDRFDRRRWRYREIAHVNSTLVECDFLLRTHPDVGVIERRLRSPFDYRSNIEWLRGLATGSLANAALRIALHHMHLDSDYQLPRFVMEGLTRGWTFLKTEHFSISLGVRRSQPDAPVEVAVTAGAESVAVRLQPYPYDLVLGILHADKLDMQVFSVLDCVDADELPKIVPTSTQRLEQGSSIYLEAGRDVTISSLHGALIYVEVTGASSVRLLPQFDAKSLQFSGWISGDPVASRIELLTRMLTDFEYKPAGSLLLSLSHHQDHFVRWNSIRHLLRLDPEVGQPRLFEALSDDHPEVRDAAQRTIDYMTEKS